MFLQGAIGRQRNRTTGYSDHDHLLATAEWLERAQDVTGDGGVSGRYHLRHGWSSSYPETTGYIVPTFLALARELAASRFEERARRCIEFLLSLQHHDGAFPAFEVAQNRTVPSVFNTAQIVHGLLAWHTATGCDRALQAAWRAGHWLVSVQDEDGAWRQHFYLNVAATYSAYAACWLAELGEHTGDEEFHTAASRHLDWVLSHCVQETGWIDLCGFSSHEHQARDALTHTIAYTLSGVLTTAEILGRRDGVDVVRTAAQAIARRLELSRWLPGVLNHRWQGQADYACLTGNAQLALLWFHLYRLDHDLRYISAALKAIDLVAIVQPMANKQPGLCGGVPGSDPISGKYLYMSIPNWAAKFFVDALLAKKTLLASLSGRPGCQWQLPDDIPTELAQAFVSRPAARPKTVMYTAHGSTKVPQMVTRWSSWKFKPDFVLIEKPRSEPVLARLHSKVREEGIGWVLRYLFGRTQPAHSRGPASSSFDDPVAFCRRNAIPFLEIDPLDSPKSLEVIRKLQPDLAIHAGAGILRTQTLAIPTMGTLNAHMGLLPFYRGMNVAEWAALNGDPVGCSVHWVDAGIDTGNIICVRVIEPNGCHSIAELRAAVDEAQLALLGEVVKAIVETGQAPPGRKQASSEGTQFFRMHPDLLAVLESELASHQWDREATAARLAPSA